MNWIKSSLLLLMVFVVLLGLGFWKYQSFQGAIAASQNQPEPMESVTIAVAELQSHRRSTTSIGTVTALRSITLRNEVAGTVKRVFLTPGQIVPAGAVLVELDVSVEQAELKEQQARTALAKTMWDRMASVGQNRAISQIELDRAKAEYDVAQAQAGRINAIIARKTIRAPFRSRVGISNVHPGQYLNEGTELTTLQGVDDFAYIDFAVSQQVAAGLRQDDAVEILTATEAKLPATILAVDSRIDVTTRNAMVRARIQNSIGAPAPGSSVRVLVPVGSAQNAVAVPVSALRKGPAGDHVFVIVPDKEGKLRAYQKEVQAGTMINDQVLLYSGISAGDKVASSGSFKLRDGILVIPSDASNEPQKR